MRVFKILTAILLATVGLINMLQPATARSVSHAAFSPSITSGIRQTDEGKHRVYLGMVAADAGTRRETTSLPSSMAIRVVARVGSSCEGSDMSPVSGARIIMFTNRTSQTAMTDESGHVLFSGTAEPAVIQIEWPIGFLPCPNSRPIVELPAGNGEVEFLAVATHG